VKIIRDVFSKSVPDKLSGKFLPNDFLLTLSKNVIEEILKIDKSKYKGEGIVLLEKDGYFRRGAFSLTIRAFVDLVIEECADLALRIRKLKKEYLENYKKVFMQVFLNDSLMNKNKTPWKTIFRDNLEIELEKVPRLILQSKSKRFP
jgi:hypothetical protein